MKKLFATDDNITLTILRVVLGVVIFAHGAQKLLGWFGGFGFAGTMGWFTGTMGVPYIFGLLVVIIEFFGSLSLIAGFLTRVWAVAIGGVMLGAMFMVHLSNGFFMNWSGQAAGEGYEYHLLVLGIVAVLAFAGGGASSVDRMLQLKKES